MTANQVDHPCDRGHTYQWGSAEPCIYCGAPFAMAKGQRFRAELRTADNPAILTDPPKSAPETAPVVELEPSPTGGRGTAAQPERALRDAEAMRGVWNADGVALIAAAHPEGPAIPEDISLTPSSLETVEVDLPEELIVEARAKAIYEREGLPILIGDTETSWVNDRENIRAYCRGKARKELGL